MKTELVKTYYRVKSHVPISESFESLAASESGKIRVVVFHGFDTSGSTKYNYKYTSLNRFKQLIEKLKNYVTFISLAQFEKNEIDNNRLNVLLVCDDGFKNNLSILPVVEQFSVPITLFISTNQLRNKTCLWPDLLDLAGHFGPKKITISKTSFLKKNKVYLSQDGISLKKHLTTGTFNQIQQLEDELNEINITPQLKNTYLEILSPNEIKAIHQNPLISMGSHGVSHTNFTNLTDQELSNELIESKEYLESLTNSPICALAFPFNLYGKREVNFAKNAGYTMLFGEDERMDNQVIPRITVNPFSSLSNQVKAILKGRY